MHIFVNIGTGIVTKVTFTFTHLLNNNCTFFTCIGNNLAKRFFNRTLDDSNTGSLVIILTLQSVK